MKLFQRFQKPKPGERLVDSRSYDLSRIRPVAEKVATSSIRAMLSDPDIKSALEIKTAGVLIAGWEVSGENADFVRDVLTRVKISDILRYVLRHVLTYGYGIVESVWAYVDSRLVIDSLIVHDSHRFELELGANGDIQQVRVLTTGQVLPRERAHVLTLQSYKTREVYTDLDACYSYWRLKQDVLLWLAIWLERYGIPTVHGSVPLGTTEERKRELLGILAKLHRDSAVLTEEGTRLELLEANAASGDVWISILDWLSMQIIRSILGQSLATDEPSRGTGTYALARVHWDVMELTFQQLRQLLEQFVQTEFIAPLICYNFAGAESPIFHIKEPVGTMLTLTDAIYKLIDADVLSPNEPWIRQLLGLPNETPTDS